MRGVRLVVMVAVCALVAAGATGWVADGHATSPAPSPFRVPDRVPRAEQAAPQTRIYEPPTPGSSVGVLPSAG